MKPYTRYKDSGVEWLGQIPEHWNCLKMKHIFIDYSEKNKPNEELLSVTQTQGVVPRAWVENRMVMPTGNLGTFKYIEKGDFAISLRSFEGGLEYCYHNGIISPAYTVLKKLKDINDNFYKFLLKSQAFILELQTSVVGIREGKNISFEELSYSLMPMPPLDEQQRIADFLNQKTCQIDGAIAQKEKMIALLQESRQVTINNAVINGLNDDVPMKDSGIEWLGQIPQHWEVKKLKFIGNIYSGIANKSGNDFSKEYKSDFKQFIPFTNICNNHIIKDCEMQYVNIKDNENQNIVKHGDLLFLMSSETLDDIGKCSLYLGLEKVYLNSFCKGFRFNFHINPKYINYLLHCKSYRTYFALVGRGFTRINIKQEYINDLQILNIPMLEQQEITEFLDKKTLHIDEAISLKRQEITKLKEYKATLIDSAVTGKIKV